MSNIILPETVVAPHNLSPVGTQPMQAPQTSTTPSLSSISKLAPGISLSIVSNSRLLLEGLLSLLTPHLDLHLVCSYKGTDAGSPELSNPSNHVVLLDGGIGCASAVAWTQRWRALTPTPHVLVLELTNDANVILACIEAGAGGYTLQGATAAEVAAAIHQVLRGQAQCSMEITSELFARLASYAARNAPPALPVPLTERELQILRYVALNYSNQDIAATLVIEIHTVKRHMHNILEKLHLRHREDAARLALAEGWLNSDQ